MSCYVIFSFSFVLCYLLHFDHTQASPAQAHVSLICTAPMHPFTGTEWQWPPSCRDVSTQQGWIIASMPSCTTHSQIHHCPKMAASAPPQSWGPVLPPLPPSPRTQCPRASAVPLLGVTLIGHHPHTAVSPERISPLWHHPQKAFTLKWHQPLKALSHRALSV